MEPLWHTIFDFILSIANIILLYIILRIENFNYKVLQKSKVLIPYKYEHGKTRIEFQLLGSDEWLEMTSYENYPGTVHTYNSKFSASNITFIRINNLESKRRL